MGIQIRLARADDFAITEAIERRSGELLIEYLSATDWPPVARAEERAGTLGFTLLATDADTGEPVGFVQVIECGEGVHIWNNCRCFRSAESAGTKVALSRPPQMKHVGVVTPR